MKYVTIILGLQTRRYETLQSYDLHELNININEESLKITHFDLDYVMC